MASGSCWISAQKLGLEDIPRSNERRAWLAISVLFLFLGVNKQLDLQTALTEAGRYLAHYKGWYEQRQVVQLAIHSSNCRDMPYLCNHTASLWIVSLAVQFLVSAGTGFWKWAELLW